MGGEKEETGPTVHIVHFTLGEHTFAFPIEQVREVIRAEGIVPVPGLPEYIQGVVNLRGQVATVLNLASRLGIPPADTPGEELMIVTDLSDAPVGILVESVPDVMQVPEESITEPPPKLQENPAARYLTGICAAENRFILLLDMEAFLDEVAGEGNEVFTMIKELAETGKGEVTA